MLVDAGLFASVRAEFAHEGRPGLFLDRDGVIVEEVNYLHRIADIAVIPGIAGAIARANAAGVPVVLVTNQAGVGRGYYDWPAFSRVQDEIEHRLAQEAGARLDAVFACAYHAQGLGHYAAARHHWRKPRPGMLQAGAERTGLDLASSIIIGDCRSDLAAGRAAGLKQGALVRTGHGVREARRLDEEPLSNFTAVVHDAAPEAIHAWLERLTTQPSAC